MMETLLVALVGTLVAVTVAQGGAIWYRLGRVEGRIDGLTQRLALVEQHLTGVEVRLEQRLAAFEVRLEQRLAAVEARLEQRFAAVEARLGRMEERLGALETRLDRPDGHDGRS